MKPEWMKWTAAMTLGLSLIVAGCSDKKGESGTPPPPGLAPAAPAERAGPEGNPPQGGGSDQGAPGANKEQSPESESKSQRR